MYQALPSGAASLIPHLDDEGRRLQRLPHTAGDGILRSTLPLSPYGVALYGLADPCGRADEVVEKDEDAENPEKSLPRRSDRLR